MLARLSFATTAVTSSSLVPAVLASVGYSRWKLLRALLGPLPHLVPFLSLGAFFPERRPSLFRSSFWPDLASRCFPWRPRPPSSWGFCRCKSSPRVSSAVLFSVLVVCHGAPFLLGALLPSGPVCLVSQASLPPGSALTLLLSGPSPSGFRPWFVVPLS